MRPIVRGVSFVDGVPMAFGEVNGVPVYTDKPKIKKGREYPPKLIEQALRCATDDDLRALRDSLGKMQMRAGTKRKVERFIDARLEMFRLTMDAAIARAKRVSP